MNLVFQLSHQIYVTSEQTKALLPKRVQTKTQVALAVGTTDELDKIAPRQPRDTTHALKILYVGNLLYLKGIHFALRGLAKLKHESNRRILLSIIGHGPDEAWLRQMAKELEIEDQVHWPGAMPRDQVLKAYSQHDVFLFPSLHDSGGMVVLEALSAGLPVICLDLGGPGQMVDITCGRVIPTDGCSEDDVVRGLSESLSELASNPEYLATLAEGAHARASELSFEHLIDRIYPQTVKKPENTACQPAR
jgi:glycosyltransferase involved in cell wall biosynthesis